MRIQLDVVRGRDKPEVIEIVAQSVAEAQARAQEQGYTVLTQRPIGFRSLHGIALSPRRAPRFDTNVFLEQLRDLLNAGLSLIEALQTLEQAATERQRLVLQPLIQRLRGGQKMSEALSADSHFSPLLVALVQASEWTSDLPQALSRHLEHEQRLAELRHRLTSAAIYPLLLVCVGSAVLLFLLLYVMPRFARVFAGMSGELPWSARAMVWWSQWLQTNAAWLAFAVSLGLAMLVLAAASPSARAQAQQRLLRWAPLRAHLRTYFLARWYRATGMLVTGGVPLPEALALSNVLLPQGLRPSGLATEQALRDGYSPAEAHARAGMTTPVAEQLMRAGERTGDLGGVLARIAQFHDAEVTRSLERGMRALEPIVMVFIGVGVGTVVVLMYLPIFELAAAIQ
ncbi:MAG: type II secretion system F family protein [Burkholderiales bacterium]|nr:type II secretion system F family protein [Burkholderiales bacterium]